MQGRQQQRQHRSISLRANWPVRNKANSFCKACSLARDCATTNCSRSNTFDQSTPKVRSAAEVTSLVSKHTVLVRAWKNFCQHQVAPYQPALASLPQMGMQCKTKASRSSCQSNGCKEPREIPFSMLSRSPASCDVVCDGHVCDAGGSKTASWITTMQETTLYFL